MSPSGSRRAAASVAHPGSESSPAAAAVEVSTDPAQPAGRLPALSEPRWVSVQSAVRSVRRRGGAARTAALRVDGASRADLARSVREGHLLRPRTGVYALPDTPPVVVEALSHCGVVACVTAAREYGLWTLDEHGSVDGARTPQTHVWIPAPNRPARLALHPHPEHGACCVLHRDAPIDEPSITSVGILHCLRQLLRCRGDEVFFAALESALRQGLLGRRGRAQLRGEIPRAQRWLVDFARTDADSGLESLLRLRLHRRGLRVTSQVRIPGVGVVDFVIGDCLIVEADGSTHEGPARHHDRLRDAQAMALGFVTLRFDYAMIVHDWNLVEAAVLAAVSRNLHRSVAGLTW